MSKGGSMIGVLDDFQMIVHKFGREMLYMNLYPIGDPHIGSPHFNEESWYRWKKTVMADRFGYVVIVGDMLENALKNSKGNSYESVLRPRDQKAWLKSELSPIKHRILGGIQGNHEGRSSKESDDCPLYDVFCKLDIEDLYRENMGFLKISLGQKNKERQFSYQIVLAHGQSENKTEKFSFAIDNMDVMISGHTHKPLTRFPSKIVIDPHNEVVREQDFTQIVVPSFHQMGGYALKGMYMPQSSRKFPIITLEGTQKEVKVHWI